MSNYVIVMSTTDSREEAKRLAREAVEKRIAACVQVTTVNSTFFWEGKVDEADEFLLLFKTTASGVDELQKYIEGSHSYDVPEILHIPISGGHQPYLDWMDTNVQAVS